MRRLPNRFVFLIVLLAMPAGGRAAVECPPARYLLPDGSPASVIEVLGDGTVVVEGVCPPIVAKLKGKRRVQKVRATWPKGTCDGLTGKVKLRAKIDETCGTLRGKLRAKKFRQKLLASVSRCDDGLLDPLVDATCPLLEGPGDGLALDAVLDVDREGGVPVGELAGDEADGQVARTRLEVEARPDATVAQVNAAIEAVDGEILLSLRRMPFLLVRIPDPGSRAALDDVVATMAGMPGIASVLPGAVPGPDALPANFAPVAGADLGRIDHHLAVRAPAAWNAQAAAVASVNVVVADLFGGGPPNGDLTATVTSADFATGALRDHGYHVSGIVTGRFGGTACTGAIGTTGAVGRGCVTGMYPGTPQLRVVDLRLGLTDLTVQKRILDRVVLSTGPVVVNTSLNDCSDGACGNPAIAAILARRWVTLVRDMDLEERFLHVTTSGNIRSATPGVDDAQTNSAYSAAALLPGLTTVFGFDLPNLSNLLVVDNVANGPAPEFAPVCMDETSKRGGTISGIGAGAGAGVGDDVWSFTDATQASGFLGGTSMAAPQVSGLAAYLWSVDPGMTVAEMQSALLQTARPVVPSTTTGDCAAASVVPAAIIDAYDAILSLDAAEPPDPIVATVRHAIMDHDGDGRFDDADVRAFMSAYFDGFVSAEQTGLPIEPTERTFGREDLNGDGFVGGSRTDAFDLDRVDSVQYGVSGYGLVQQGVEGGVATFDEAAATDLDVLCYYAYSDLYEGTAAVRTTLLGSAICNPIRLLIGFPQTVEVGVPEVLSIEVLREDPQLGSAPLAGALVEIDVLGGGALTTDGVTDEQGRFETEAAADGSASPMRIVVRVRDVPSGPVLVEGFVDATLATTTTTTTTTTTVPMGGTVTLREGGCVATAEVSGSPFYNNTDRQQDGPVPVSLVASGTGNSASASGTSSASATASLDAALIPATTTGGIGGIHFTGGGTHQAQIVVLDPDALGGLTAFGNASIGCGGPGQEFSVSRQVAFSVTGSITVQPGTNGGGGSVAVQFANPPFTTFFADSIFDGGTLSLSGSGILNSGQYKISIGANSQSYVDRNGGPTQGDGSISMDVQLVFSAPGATTTTVTTTTSTTPPSDRFVCDWIGFGEECDPFPGCGCDVDCSPAPGLALDVSGTDDALTAIFRDGGTAVSLDGSGSGGTLTMIETADPVGGFRLNATLRPDGVLEGRMEEDFGCGEGFTCQYGWNFEMGCGAPPTTTSSTTTTVTTSTSTSSVTTSTAPSTTTSVTTTTSTLPPGAGFDYRLYPATGPDAPSVMLVDEFRSETADLGLVAFHLAPTGIGGAFPVDPKSDLTCYQHPGAIFAGTASVVNRFSTEVQILSLTGPVATCVPRDDALVQVDHLTCYGASGESAGTVLSIFDRFQSESVTVGAPTLYCTPTDKNGEGLLVPPTPQVVCYGTTPPGVAPGAFEVANQFHTAPLDLADPTALCVSSFVESASGS